MKRRHYWRDRIEALDPVADHQEIYRISAGHEFPWDYQRALEFALFRTYCAPSISALLAATGEFRDRTQKRYDDTALLMAELAAHGYDSPRGIQALRAINRAHGHYAISNEDMRYVLSTFIYEPIDWIDRFGWRRLTEQERLAGFHFYRQVGLRMGIREVPEDFAEFRAVKQEYERSTFGYADTNYEIGTYTMDLLCGWYPRPLRPAVRLGIRSLLDDQMRTAFGFRAAPALVGGVSRAALRARARVMRLMPARSTSRLARDPHNRTYPGYPRGYQPADLGVTAPPQGIDAHFLHQPGTRRGATPLS